jgi:lipopolysaccharide heptosyltransferase II
LIVSSKRVQNPNDVDRLLVVLPTWVGDFVMATPALRAMRSRFASARITFLAVPNLAGLIQPGDWMDEVVYWPPRGRRNHPVLNWRLVRSLRDRRFDLAVVLPNSFRSAMAVRLSVARRRVGYGRDGRGWMLTDRVPVSSERSGRVPYPMCDHYGGIAEAVGCDRPGDRLNLHVSQDDEDSIRRRLSDCDVLADVCASSPVDRPMVVLSPGSSFGASKLWLPERFAATADRLISELGARVLITCGPGEESIAHGISGLMDREAVVMDGPLLTLGQLKALLRMCSLLVCNDAGPRHIAKAFGRPVVSIFGPTHQGWTRTDYPLERAVQIDVACGPCQKKVCPLGHHECMTGIGVDRVVEHCVELLGSVGVESVG